MNPPLDYFHSSQDRYKDPFDMLWKWQILWPLRMLHGPNLLRIIWLTSARPHDAASKIALLVLQQQNLPVCTNNWVHSTLIFQAEEDEVSDIVTYAQKAQGV